MDWGRVQFFFGEVWRSFTRNLLMQFTAIGTVAVTIALLGGFLFARATLSGIGNDVVKQIEIGVFLKQSATAADAKSLQTRLGADPRVKSVSYVPKVEGLRELRDRLKGIDTSMLTSNPLPDELRVRVVDPQYVRPVADVAAKLPGVENVEYAHDAVQKVLTLSDVLGRIGLGIVVVLVFTAAILISNTIRLTVFARRREIAIMQLVGASSLYIRMPFICEGLITGLLGSLVAVTLLAIAKSQLLPKLGAALSFIPIHDVPHDNLILALELLAVGAGVGIVASWLSLNRYLRA